MQGREYAGNGGEEMRYGYNGQEADNEIFGIQSTSYTAEYWQYDARLGRRWNVDPVEKEWESSYASFSNNPLYFVDPLGLDSEKPGGGKTDKKEQQAPTTIDSGEDSQDTNFPSYRTNQSSTPSTPHAQQNTNSTDPPPIPHVVLDPVTVYGKRGPLHRSDYWSPEWRASFSWGWNHPQESDLSKIAARAIRLPLEACAPIGFCSRSASTLGRLSFFSRTARYIPRYVKVAKTGGYVLSKAELLRIENAATRINKPITVVGSRASGKAGAYSDWDYVIEGLNSKSWSKIKNSLPGSRSILDNTPRNIDIFKGPVNPNLPHITIYPR
jgi:RHS repeat-associated protein